MTCLGRCVFAAYPMDVGQTACKFMNIQGRKKKLWPLILIIVIGLGIRLALSWQPIEHLAAYPLVDDSFYSLNIARNIAQGKGLTCDGIHKTNGFQPLYVFLAVPVYYLLEGDKVLPVHIVLSIISVISIFTMVLIYKLVTLVANEKAAWFAVFLWSVSPDVIEFELNGLETGLYIFLLSWCLYYYLLRVRDARPPAVKNHAVLGLLAGLTILARIDASFFMTAMVLDMIILRRAYLTKHIKGLAAFLLVCGLVISPWFLHNLLSFGSLMPTSGKAVRFLSTFPIFSEIYDYGSPMSLIPASYYGGNIIMSFVKLCRTPLIYSVFWLGLFFGGDLWGYIMMGASGSGIGYLMVRYKDDVRQYWHDNQIRSLNFTLIFSLFILLSYIFYVFGRHYYVRYYFPIIFISILYSGVVYDFLVNRLAAVRANLNPRWVHAVVLVILSATFGYRLSNRYFYHMHPTGGRYYKIARWINQNIAPDKVVGVFSSGTIGYFAKPQVINLDGVVNKDAYLALKEKKMLDYIKPDKIDYVIDLTPQINEMVFNKISSSPIDNRRLKLIKQNIYGFDLYQVVGIPPGDA